MSKNALPLLTALTLMTAGCASTVDESTNDETTAVDANDRKQAIDEEQRIEQAGTTPQWIVNVFWPPPPPPPRSGGGCEDWECGSNHNRRLMRV